MRKRREDSPRRQLLHGRHVIREALKARRRELFRLLVSPGRLGPDWIPIVELARSMDLAVETCDDRQWRALSIDGVDSRDHRCALEAGPIPECKTVEQLCKVMPERPEGRWVLALDGVEDPQNVGSLARVVEAAGAQGLLLTDRRAPPLSAALARASAGAVEWLSVCRVPNLIRGLEDLKRAGFWVIAADPLAEQVLYDLPDRLLRGDLVVVLGAEGRGLRKSVREEADHPVRLPMGGKVESLNVATAGAIIFYELGRRCRDPQE